ncbi:MAG: putative molybdenum carrier protein [Desulfobacterales bacterium]|nr:MAG: putative molybdenum carrier protein [Desulfobacterales bacterium]
MIKKIISGGQTGVDRAALDAAIKLSIAHGGWIPKGRLTENGPLPSKYQLKETKSSSYAERTEKNVLDADGTLIISRGPLTGGSEYTRDMAIKHQRPWLHIDLKQRAAFQAATMINNWVINKRIEILNVAGPRASKDSKIYHDAFNILESTYYLGLIENGMPGAEAPDNPMSVPTSPSTSGPPDITQAVQRLISEMSLKDKTTVANMLEEELPNLYITLGGYIINKFGLLSGNTKLMASCRSEVNGKLRNEEDAAAVIIKVLWQKLQQTHRLRVIK